MDIRPYEARDRVAVREICCDTADRGEPMESFFSDREVLADVITRYYTDFDSSASWVAVGREPSLTRRGPLQTPRGAASGDAAYNDSAASGDAAYNDSGASGDAADNENENEVLGYLTGCLDTRRFLRTMIWRIVPVTFFKALLRGSLWHRFIWANVRWPKRGGFSRSQILAEYPAHLHINLRKDFRGHGAGRELLERFLRQASAAGVRGVHAGVSDSNVAGQRFFEHFGFVELGREARPAPQPAFTIIYGKRLPG